jgi:hypothetical protein
MVWWGRGGRRGVRKVTPETGGGMRQHSLFLLLLLLLRSQGGNGSDYKQKQKQRGGGNNHMRFLGAPPLRQAGHSSISKLFVTACPRIQFHFSSPLRPPGAWYI